MASIVSQIVVVLVNRELSDESVEISTRSNDLYRMLSINSQIVAVWVDTALQHTGVG